MALFIGGPADGWRIEVDISNETVIIPINPHAPAFTTDSAVLSASTGPGYKYKKEQISCNLEEYSVYIPQNWNCVDLIEALVIGYKQEKNRDRLKYVRTAEGQLYDTDDRLPAGRPYKIG